MYTYRINVYLLDISLIISGAPEAPHRHGSAGHDRVPRHLEHHLIDI